VRGLVLTLLLALGGAAPAPADGLLEALGRGLLTGELPFLLGDVGAEKRLGDRLLQSHLQQVRGRLVRDGPRLARVEGLFAPVAGAAQPTPYDLEVYLVEDRAVNAYAFPGGGIFLHTGMLEFARSDAEVACVLGHEVGHVIERHAMEQLRRDYAFRGAIQALFEGGTAAQVAQAAASFKQLSFSRDDEIEADDVGMRLARQAGFDPAGAWTLWTRMREQEGQRSDLATFLSTHPSNQERIQNARGWLQARGLPVHRTGGGAAEAGGGPAPAQAPGGARSSAERGTTARRLEGLRARLRRIFR